MKKNLLYIFTTSALVCLSSVLVFAQNNQSVSPVGNPYLISANAGGVNYIEGKVSVTQNNGRSGYLLRGDKLEVGEKVSTGADGKVEVLLNPGSYIRLADNSSFEFGSTSLDDLQLKLNRGSAIFEVITDDDFNFAVNTPKGKFNIVTSGVYRIDVLGDGSGKIEVWKGKAEVGESNAVEVKSGRTATANGNQVAVEKFDRDDKDALELWSKDRAKELAKVNSRLQRGNLRNSLLNSFNRRGWNIYNSYGLWVLDSFSGNYCFLPFGYGWSSPYGYGYGRDIWYLRMPNYVYYQPPTNQTSPPQVGTLRSGASVPSRINNTNRRDAVPPFQKVQNDVGMRPVYRDSNPAVFDNSPRFPTQVSTPQAPPTLISPTTGAIGKGGH